MFLDSLRILFGHLVFATQGEGRTAISWRQIWSSNCVPLIRFFSHFGLASELNLVVSDIVEAQAMSFALKIETRFKQLETCYTVASRACGKRQETCYSYSVASRACGK